MAARKRSSIASNPGIRHVSLDMDKAGIRKIDSLMKDIEIIETECIGNKREEAQSKLDDFQRYKLELNAIILSCKHDIKTKKGIEERVGTNTESLKLKQKIASNLQTAKALQIKMEATYKEQQHEADIGDTPLSAEELKSRQELVSLMKQDLEYTQLQFEPRQHSETDGAANGFNLARSARKKRAKQNAVTQAEPVPLTAKQQAFIQESIERDAILDEKLDIIYAGVKMLGHIGHDINEELDKQNVMLDEVEAKMEKVHEKLETKNEKIRAILDESGGATRWCPLVILLVILLACLGYLWKAFMQ
mmetsp:Transcript_67700/g.107451  ORF Transcript_67700/g.107451 Transcript_67700/m.107451 type:complete len:305 (-) Transcript_67700:136-1050(-)|eukprot:CAMPEP_0197053694 /NCGR_PEP_ID=MMETSP1384-20130603/27892_1 /TAXON_ID=29189 /ORGANISM="Ammonia sp." /LENGTH=304 /DNA_ID=CAMNT_0042486631 /DNA_START=25 /DNA_END=939 /DNA_ORIENTATION=+